MEVEDYPYLVMQASLLLFFSNLLSVCMDSNQYVFLFRFRLEEVVLQSSGRFAFGAGIADPNLQRDVGPGIGFTGRVGVREGVEERVHLVAVEHSEQAPEMAY